VAAGSSNWGGKVTPIVGGHETLAVSVRFSLGDLLIYI